MTRLQERQIQVCRVSTSGRQYNLHALTLARVLALTHMMLPAVTMAALAALSGVRHCQGVAAEQNQMPEIRAMTAPLIAFTMPTPNAPSVR